MSRIFDALQKSELEHTGVECPDMISVAGSVFDLPAEKETTDVPIDFSSLEISPSPTGHMVFLNAPETLSAEKFRFLGVRLRQIRQNRPLKTVLVTSSLAGEGKSMVAVNLAGVLARRKKHKVLLIEGDLRRPVMAEQFGISTMPGLSEWLQADSSTATHLYRLNGAEFWLIPAGQPPNNPLELLQSPRLALLMQELLPSFDWVIVDSPPLLPLADTSVWARFTDGTLLVVRQSITEKSSLRRALEIVRKTDLLGVVLNATSNRNHRNYYQRYTAMKELQK